MRKIKLILIGFGNVGQEFVRVLLEKHDKFSEDYGVEFSIVTVTTGKRGSIINPAGLDLENILAWLHDRGSFNGHPDFSAQNAMQIIQSVEADVVVELSPLNIQSGQPAIDHIVTSLRSGKHVVTTNKGPIAHSYEALKKTAEENGRAFLFEGTVMDGTPIFNLVRETLMGCEINGVRGIFNGTTNYILTEMEKGRAFQTVLKEAQDFGWAEADPSMDVDGWDAAAKTSALMNVLMNANIKPGDVAREGIRNIKSSELQALKAQGAASVSAAVRV
jgi:homoserine dehydrogenase